MIAGDPAILAVELTPAARASPTGFPKVED